MLWLFLFCADFGAFCQPLLYVTNQNSSTVSVVNTQTNTVSANLPTSFSPAGAALAPNGARIFTACPNGNAVFIFNTATNALAATLSIGQAPMGVAADTTRLYVTLNGNAALAVYNSTTLAQQAVLRVGFGPSAVAVSPGSGLVYVANTFSSTVTVVDPARIGTNNNPVIGSIAVPDSPVAIVISPNGLSAWVLSSATPMLSRINLGNGVVAERIALPLQPAGLAIAPDNTRIYVTGYGPTVASVDVASGRVMNTLRLPGCATARCVAMGAAVSADSKTLYVANTSRDQVAVVDTERNQVTANIAVQAAPRTIVPGLASPPSPTSTEASAAEEQY